MSKRKLGGMIRPPEITQPKVKDFITRKGPARGEFCILVLGHDHTQFREGFNISGRFALHFFIFSYRCQRLSLQDVRTCDWTCVFIYKYTYAYIGLHMYESEH